MEVELTKRIKPVTRSHTFSLKNPKIQAQNKNLQNVECSVTRFSRLTRAATDWEVQTL
jgi:hypothetical protein